MKLKPCFLLILISVAIDINAQIKFALPIEPQLFYGKNKTALVYDVHLRDSLGKEFKIESFEIFDDKNKLVYTNNYVKKSVFEGDSNRFVKYVWIDVKEIPSYITHKIRYKIGKQDYKFSKVIKVSRKSKVVSVIPPVQKGIWGIGGAPSDSLSHRRTHLEFFSVYDSIQDGYIIGYNNQRFAMDFSKLGEEGRKANNGGKHNSDYNDYGENVVAVADGKVVAVMDFIPDNPNPPYRKSNWEIDSICGNYIALNIGDSLIALYAHIKPNSIRVKVGDVIKKGAVIGQIGNSGKSSGAHLHFQISKFKVPYKESGNSFLSEGISFVFDKYISYNWQTGFDWINNKDTTSLKFMNPKKMENKLPYFNEIIEIK